MDCALMIHNNLDCVTRTPIVFTRAQKCAQGNLKVQDLRAPKRKNTKKTKTSSYLLTCIRTRDHRPSNPTPNSIIWWRYHIHKHVNRYPNPNPETSQNVGHIRLDCIRRLGDNLERVGGPWLHQSQALPAKTMTNYFCAVWCFRQRTFFLQAPLHHSLFGAW